MNVFSYAWPLGPGDRKAMVSHMCTVHPCEWPPTKILDTEAQMNFLGLHTLHMLSYVITGRIKYILMQLYGEGTPGSLYLVSSELYSMYLVPLIIFKFISFYYKKKNLTMRIAAFLKFCESFYWIITSKGDLRDPKLNMNVLGTVHGIWLALHK